MAPFKKYVFIARFITASTVARLGSLAALGAAAKNGTMQTALNTAP
jgi:hypothetical protein